jgi:hypothetical protein
MKRKGEIINGIFLLKFWYYVLLFVFSFLSFSLGSLHFYAQLHNTVNWDEELYYYGIKTNTEKNEWNPHTCAEARDYSLVYVLARAKFFHWRQALLIQKTNVSEKSNWWVGILDHLSYSECNRNYFKRTSKFSDIVIM